MMLSLPSNYVLVKCVVRWYIPCKNSNVRSVNDMQEAIVEREVAQRVSRMSDTELLRLLDAMLAAEKEDRNPLQALFGKAVSGAPSIASNIGKVKMAGTFCLAHMKNCVGPPIQGHASSSSTLRYLGL